MFKAPEEHLKSLGAHITVKEINQQPALWATTLNIYETQKDEIEAFLTRCEQMSADDECTVVFTGAGTSAYVGDTITPYLTRFGRKGFIFKSVATTDIVASPEEYLRSDHPTILVSFARSGNSPESLAAVERALAVCDNILLLNITCAPEGRLAVEYQDDERALTLLIPDANDQGFAMTGSYSSMELLATLIFDSNSLEKKRKWVAAACAMGKEVLEREDEIHELTYLEYDRVTYLGSSGFAGLAQEAQLKVLELAAGKVATSHDSSMGYRHGPKSFINSKTLVFVFVSNDPYTREYDIDILKEIAGDKIACETIAIQQAQEHHYEGVSFTFSDHFPLLPAAYLVLPYVMFAQMFALMTSVKVGNTPDTPSASGTVNRVVKGVTIHKYGA